MSGTPHGLISQASDSDNLLVYDHTLPAKLEPKVLVDFPVGAEFARQRGYSRFVEFRERVEGKRYCLCYASN